MWDRLPPRGTSIPIEGASQPAIVHKNGMVIFGNDGKMVSSYFLSNLDFLRLFKCQSRFSILNESLFHLLALRVRVNSAPLLRFCLEISKHKASCVLGIPTLVQHLLTEQKWVEPPYFDFMHDAGYRDWTIFAHTCR